MFCSGAQPACGRLFCRCVIGFRFLFLHTWFAIDCSVDVFFNCAAQSSAEAGGAGGVNFTKASMA
jgi:hypothetical protein